MYYHDFETESPKKRADRKFRAIKTLLEKASLYSNEFKARMETAGLDIKDIRNLEDYGTIPPLHKKDLISLQSERGLEWLLSCEIGELSRIYQSPGPIFDPEGSSRDYWGWAEGFFAAGFRPKDLVQMTFSYHLTPAGLMLEEPLREIGCCVIPAGPGNTEVQLELLTRLPVTGFVGMTSYLKIIGQKAKAAGFDLKKDIKLRTAFVAAEMLPQSLREEVEEMFSMTIRQGYGTADVGCIAYECDQLGGMHTTSRALVEICDPTTGTPLPLGEVGEVVVTPFTGAYPLIRLATGDLSAFIEKPCACGRTSFKLDGIKGRADDTAKVKGQFIYPGQAAKIMAEFGQIQCWQLLVTNPGGRDTLTCRLQLSAPID
ncbi:MAG: AMP-binding protein, partial [Proteobacteria bacterium]|nr:AMP-binding protein [Pseudomonadota bacterium]